MDIDDLVSKLRTLEQPDSNVDIWMFRQLLGGNRHRWRMFCTNAHWPLGGYQYASPTGSVDVAILLLKSAMPGFLYRVAECSVSDDAFVAPDFNDPMHGKKLLELFPEAGRRDPVEFMGTDVDMRPPGRPAIALCLSIMIARRKMDELIAAQSEKQNSPTPNHKGAKNDG